MDHIAHDNIFEYLSVDLDMEEDELRIKLSEMGTSAFIDYLRNKEVSLFSTPTLLSTELRDLMGSVLINKDIPLDKYLDTLLDRYVLDEYFTTTPFAIQTSAEILRIYRTKATNKVNNEIEKTVTKQKKFKRFYKKVDSGEIDAQNQFNSFMSSLLEKTDGISFMLKMIKRIDFHKDIFIQTTNSTYICIALAMLHANKSKSVDMRNFVQKVTCTSFMQNAGIFTGLVSTKTSQAEKSKKSAMIVTKLCKDENVTEAVLERYSYTDDEGTPVFHRGGTTNFYKNLLLTSNLFIDLVRKNQFSPESLEVHKAMYELSKKGYADPNIVSLLSELFLPKMKHQLLEHAFQIQEHCNEKPVIWGVAGDMLPIRLICRKEDCEHGGAYKTLIPQDISIVAEGIYEAKTKSGLYYTCEKLTNNLQFKYQEIKGTED
ncbi:MAG: hypothetical protein C0602_13615 [Denitrovibrio sp.]|nr:MAG: hypothetical protein C0602_13615 [Denitrovibrio sp.]